MVIEILQQLTDDQTAILGCVGAMAVSTLMLMLTFHTNPKNKVSDSSQPVAPDQKRELEPARQEERRAA